MNVQTAPFPGYLYNRALQGKIAVVIDVLRAASSMIEALANGCGGILVTQTVEEASKKAAGYAKDEVILAGEREGKRIAGFHLGNSPCEYSKEKVSGKAIIFTTSNGTKAIKASLGADIVIGSFSNISYLCNYLFKENRDIVFVCSGKNNRPCLEDSLCAGMCIDRLSELQRPVSLDDNSDKARTLYLKNRDNLKQEIAASPQGLYLKDLGFARDIAWCTILDRNKNLPCLSIGNNGDLILHNAGNLCLS